MILSTTRLNEVAVCAFLAFGCTCGLKPYLELEKLDPITVPPIAKALAAFHFRKCHYEPWKLARKIDERKQNREFMRRLRRELGFE